METKDFTLHREGVDGDFDVTQYGTAGRPVIAFPEGDSSCASWGRRHGRRAGGAYRRRARAALLR